jgi:tetratricopeptide (TPR) repeat protein
MRHLILLTILGLAAFQVGCATSSSGAGSDTKKAETTLEHTVTALPAEPRFIEHVEARSLKGLDPKDCPSSVGSLPVAVQKSWKALIVKANACLVAKNWFIVEQLGTLLSDIEPRGPWGSYYLGLVAEVREDLPRAFWMVELSLKKSPDLVIARYQHARLLWKTDSFTEAVKELKEIVKLDSSLVDAHLMLGQIYMRDFEVDKASEEFKGALAKRPAELLALDAMAEIEVYTGNGLGALGYLERATAVAPARLDLMVKRAQVHEALLNQPEEALTIYRSIQTQSPRIRWEGVSPVDVNQKIRELEKVVQTRKNVNSTVNARPIASVVTDPTRPNVAKQVSPSQGEKR